MVDPEEHKPEPWKQKIANIYARTIIRSLLILKNILKRTYKYLDSKV